MMTLVTLPTTRFSVDEFTRMVDADVFGTARVELINGRIYRMAPQRPPHIIAVSKIARLLARVVPDNEWLFGQGTIYLDSRTCVDPEFTWFAAPVGTPEDRLPSPLLLIEVSHRSYRKDSGIKLRKYAKAGVKDYWIVNIPADRIEVCREPVGPSGRSPYWRYASVEHFHRGQSIALLNRPEVVLPVDELLP